MIIELKRIWSPVFSPVNCLSVPYEGWCNGERLGTLHCNPVTKELSPDSVRFLEDSGYTNIEIKII